MFRDGVRDSRKRFSLHAAQRIEKGQAIACFNGVIVDTQPEDCLCVHICKKDGKERFLLRDDEIITEEEGTAWIANTDSLNPNDKRNGNNATIVGDGRKTNSEGKMIYPYIKATRLIEKGEEIFLAYGRSAKLDTTFRKNDASDSSSNGARKRGRPRKDITLTQAYKRRTQKKEKGLWKKTGPKRKNVLTLKRYKKKKEV